jgi:KaiC/GvpD/RAD55 family RecA-like ATPase
MRQRELPLEPETLDFLRQHVPAADATIAQSRTPAAARIKTVRDLPSIFDIEVLPVSWTLEGLVPAGQITLLTGAPGVGKSMLALALAGAVVHGLPFIGRATLGAPVLVLDRESPHAVFRERLDLLGVAPHEDFHVWGMWNNPEPPHPSFAAILEFARERPLIVVDSLVCFHDGDEQSASETRRFFHVLRRLTAAGATVLVLHHTGKGEKTKDYRGSSDIAASVDAAFVLERAEGGSGLARLTLRCFKMRCDEAPQRLAIEFSDGRFSASTDPYILENTRARDTLRQILSNTPGATQTQVLTAMREQGITRNVADRALKQSVIAGEVTESKGGHNSKTYVLAELLELQL